MVYICSWVNRIGTAAEVGNKTMIRDNRWYTRVSWSRCISCLMYDRGSKIRKAKVSGALLRGMLKYIVIAPVSRHQQIKSTYWQPYALNFSENWGFILTLSSYNELESVLDQRSVSQVDSGFHPIKIWKETIRYALRNITGHVYNK